jgi:hypothetical protein
MKLLRTLAAVAVAIFISSTANAAIVNFGNPVFGGSELIPNVGLIPSGQSGTFFTTPSAFFGIINGSIANNTKITFTYTLANSGSAFLGSSGGFSNSPAYAAANSNGFSVATGGVFASANVSGTSGTTSIGNVSGETISFSSVFIGFLKSFASGCGCFVGKINYNVSAVPLPDSVLMFGAAIAGMFAFSRFKQRKESSTLA